MEENKNENLKQETTKTQEVEKQETIMDTANTKETRKKAENQKSKLRMVLVLLFVLLFAGISYIQLRGSYLEYLELGEKYTSIFYTNIMYR